MATITGWNPYGVSLNITAAAAAVTRTSATQFSVKFNVSWEVRYSGNQTNYGMSATSGGKTTVISAFGTNRAGGNSTLTGTFSISGNGAATKSVTVSFKNYEENWQGTVTKSATKLVTVSVSVPALASYAVKYNANGGSGAPSPQTKWKDQTLKLSGTKPTRTGYSFQGWGTSAGDTSVAYAAGANYTNNAAITLYAIWKANTYAVKYDANGGTGAPGSQTKTYGVALTLSGTKPTRTNYTFKGWGTSASATTVSYAAGASYTANAAVTLYAVWELAYTKPRITDISVARCNAAGDPFPNGTCARVTFRWACDQEATSMVVHWTSAVNTGSDTLTVSGTSGTVNAIIGNDSLNANNTYTLEIVVADRVDSSAAKRTLNSLSALIHGLPEYGGLAFGKTAELAGYVDFGKFQSYHRQNAVFENDVSILAKSPEGKERRIFSGQSASGDADIGYDCYQDQNGNVNLYAQDIVHFISNIATPGSYRPYRRRGDRLPITIRTSGYVTNSGKEVHFFLPVSEPIVGSPAVSVVSGNGFILRQGAKYTHGSAASTYVTPTSYDATVFLHHGVQIVATFAATTNVTNNDAIGIYWNGTITFS